MGIPRRLRAPGAIAWKALGQIGFAGTLLTAVVTCSFERQNARDAGVQTYNLSRVAAFRDSGGKLDRAAAAFNDAIVSDSDTSAARQSFNAAMAEHASVVQAMIDVFGDTDRALYMKHLKALNHAVADCHSPLGLPAIIKAMNDVIVQRERMAALASKQAMP